MLEYLDVSHANRQKLFSNRESMAVDTTKLSGGKGFIGFGSGGGGDSCCKICPTDRFPYRGVSAFSIGAKEAFIQVMEKGHATHRIKHMAAGIIPALNVGQSGCCPVCPVSLPFACFVFMLLDILLN